ncbi:MAG: PAS domain S-box protein [Mariprofundales bacterium]|nr:PAS domain S-box protein [Mariprofundales bacterium]
MNADEKITVLVVDDDPVIRLMLEQFFDKNGYQVAQADNGESGLALVKQCQPSCVLMDLSMPNMDGLEVCRRLRDNGNSVPVIMMTAQEGDAMVDQCYQAGASDYINKPIHWAVLRNRVRNLIAQWQAAHDLRASERRLRQIFNASPDAFWLMNADNDVLLFTNDRYQPLFGQCDDDLRNNPLAWMDCVHPEDRPQLAQLTQAYYRGDSESMEAEFRTVRSDGGIGWVMLRCFPIRYATGAVSRWASTASDITARKQSQEKFQLLTQSVEAVPWSFDLVGNRFTYVGDQVMKVLGFSKSALRTMEDWEALIHPEDREHAVRYCQDQTALGQPHVFEYRMVVNGETVWVQERVSVTMGRGDPIGISGFMFNITKDHQKQEKVRILSQAVDQAGESIMITDKSGTIEYVNPAFTTITGYSAEEALGKNPRILKSGNQPPEFYEQMWKTIINGEPWHSTIVDKRKDGTQYPAINSIAPIMDDNHHITHYVAIQQDMTAHEELEERFRQAQKMEALGTLVGGIAHDFNNMLSGITGNIYLAKRQASALPKVVEKLERIEQLSLKASDMIKHLMAFARKSTVEMRPFGLASFMREVCKLCSTTMPERISLKKDICSDELTVRGDATQIQQLLMNLMNNARDALTDVVAPEVSVRLTKYESDAAFCASHPNLKGRHFACIMVADNGCGISDEDQKHIFEPFYTTKEVGLGTGLGLSMAYGAVQSHGGILTVKSAPSKGTAFHIYLPLIEEKQTVKAAVTNGDNTVCGDGELILLVDDNANVREVGKNVLESLNYRVLEASDGLEAVKIFTDHQHEIAMIMMDIVMPRLGGVQATERIQRIDPNAKVLFVSGYDRDHALGEEMPSEEYTVLSKPYSIPGLSHMVREIIDAT